MKKYLFILILLISFKGYGQFVVSDPGNLAVNTTIQTLNQATNLLNEFMAKAEKLKLATDMFEQLKTIKEITDYIDDIACLTSELQFNLNYANNYSCLTILNFKTINVNMRYATDIIVKVFLTKNLFTMSSGDRLGILNNVLEVLKKTVADIAKINSNIRILTKDRIVRKYFRENVYASGTVFLTNRYDYSKRK